MLLLPRGAPVYEDLSAATVDPPKVLLKLRDSALTGYLRFTFPNSSVVLLFDRGRLISCMQERGEARLHGLDALSAAFETIATEGGKLDIYRLAPNLVGSIHALLQGEMLYRAQELRLIDAKGLLAKMKAQSLNGCLRIYTEDRNALIFYKEGAPVGFFHDGSPEIETSANESQRIAGLPGAKLDVLSVQDIDALAAYDLLEMVNVQKVWEMTAARRAARLNKITSEAATRAAHERQSWLTSLEGDLKEVAEAYLGRAGRNVIDKALVNRGGSDVFLDAAGLNLLWSDVERAAKLLAGQSKTSEMLTVMRNEVDQRLRQRQLVANEATVQSLPIIDIVQVSLWFAAGAISLYFSIGSDRIWTSISTGFFLIFIAQAYLVAPWVETPRLAALHAIIGTIAIMVMTHGFQAYYVFSRTLEAGGSKLAIYAATLGVIAGSVLFLWINPSPSPAVLRHIHLIENGNWVFLSLINLDMIRKIYLEIRDTPIARGFIAFGLVFTLIFLWRGSELYLQVYGWDSSWSDVTAALGAQLSPADLARIEFSSWVHRIAGVASSVSVAATFVYLYRLLR